MNFRISGTFTDSIAKFTGEEQKAVKTTVFDLQVNPANPGLQFHKLDRARDKNFWSVRVSRDIRIIVHKTIHSLLICYVAHHDDAYHWAERRKLETHPKTGAAQIVEIRETVQEILVPIYVEEEKPKPRKPKIFNGYSDNQLLEYGVPEEWLEDIKGADEDSILEIADHLPEEAAEAVLEIATGGKPALCLASPNTDPFEHPDAQRRFRIMENVEELERALEFPWEKWTIFLHPAQKETVEKSYSGPARVSGSAGTGKTIVALHRAVFLAKQNPEARILLTTFSDALARMLHMKLRRLIVNQPMLAERIDVEALDHVGIRLFERNVSKAKIADTDQINEWIQEVSNNVEHQFSQSFLISEWAQVVDAWQLENWEAYKEVARIGRKTRLPENKRKILWELFAKVRSKLDSENLTTLSAIFTQLSVKLSEFKNPVYDYVIVDEAQDLSVSQLKFLSTIGKHTPEALFFSGDLGQRIFQQPFSWKSLGVDIRGRSRTLRINYRTSHQIRSHADRLLDPEVQDVDGNKELRSDTISVFNGTRPVIKSFNDTSEEIEYVSGWISKCIEEGINPNEIGVFVRSLNELPRATEALQLSKQPYQVLSEGVEPSIGRITISTMHLAKGLEFRAVTIIACDDEIIPSQERIDAIGDTADLEEIYNTERHLLYVACTRARDKLLITSQEPASEFLDDIKF